MTIHFEKRELDHVIAAANKVIKVNSIKEVPTRQVKRDIDKLLENQQIKNAVALLAAE